MPRTHVAEIQRNRMLLAAIEAVAEVGYGRMTVAQVIGRARVSRKTFYDVFADREDCFLAVFEQAVDRASTVVSEAYEREVGWRNGVRAGLAALLALMDEQPDLARLCIVEALGAGERVLGTRARVLARAAGAVDDGRGLSRSPREPPAVTAEAVVGAVFAVLHARLLEDRDEPLTSLLGQLMSIIVLPYLGTRAADRELTRRARPRGRDGGSAQRQPDPMSGLKMRLTYRTVRVLSVIGEHPGASNREIAERSGITDQGQISKLLTRLARLELTVNVGPGQERGAANAWHLTPLGVEVERTARPR
jgi:AcrR family transcriptional regulator/DNA-binding MarR family transcriptional regulator